MYSFVLVKASLQSGNFAAYSTIYELPTGENWASELWLSHWRRRMWDVGRGGKVSFRGFFSAGTQGSKRGTGDLSHFSHAQTPTASDLSRLSVLGWWRTNGRVTAREKAVQDVSYLLSPFLCHDNRLPHKPFLHAHTVFRYLANNWLAEVSTYLTEEKEKLIETHPRLHTQQDMLK